VTQVIFEESILKNPEEKILGKLQKCASTVPFVLTASQKTSNENVLENFSKISHDRPQIGPNDQINEIIEKAGLKLIHS
jgi:hypothetical protein